LGDFLDAAIARARDSRKGQFTQPLDRNPWFRRAHILYAGKFYE